MHLGDERSLIYIWVEAVYLLPTVGLNCTQIHHHVYGAEKPSPGLQRELCTDTQPRPIRDRPEINEGAMIKFESVH